MMNTPKVSVILPVYNPGPGIDKCIESLQSQTLDGLEFIFVDDCSTDGSIPAVEAWAAQDDRVRIIRNEENLGAGPSRNRGIEAARGEYLSFVDPDDYISPDFYELLYATAVSGGGHDIAKGLRISETSPHDRNPSGGIWWNRQILERPPWRPLYLCFCTDHFTALYRRDFIIEHEAWYGRSRKAQDTTFLLKACYHTNDIVVEPLAVYFYVQREDSVVHRLTPQVFQYEIDGFWEKVEFLADVGLDNHACEYLAAKLDRYLKRHRSTVQYGSELHDGYYRFLDGFLSLLEQRSIRERVLRLAPAASRYCKNLWLTMPGKRTEGEGDIRISIIVPIYNASLNIDRCIQSLRQQLLDGLEFIFVDDCSTDGSLAKVEAWATEDDRVHIIHNEKNLGAGPSCTCGIEMARGDYLSFVDPNDDVSPDFYEVLYAAATEGDGHDMAKGASEDIATNGKRFQKSSQLVNGQIRSARRKNTPLFAAFSNEPQAAIYRRSLFSKGVYWGTSRTTENTTLLLSVCLLSEDIATDDDAIYGHSTRTWPLTESHQLDSCMGDFDSIIEKVALLWERPRDRHTRSYLEAKLAECITSRYMSHRNSLSPVGDTGDFAQELAGLVDYLKALGFLSGKDPVYSVLFEHREVLPSVDALPEDLKAEGAQDWVRFIDRTPDAKLTYCITCARAQETALRHVAHNLGLHAFKNAYAQIVKRVSTLPPKPRAVILGEFHRKLASWQNIREALEKAGQKLRP